MKQVIDKVRAAMLERGSGHFVCWSGVYFDRENRFIRVDKVFLNVVYMGDNEDIYFRRIIGLPRTNKAGEDCLHYSIASNSYRVMDGPRKGRVVLSYELADDESFRLVGLHKKVEYGREPNKLCERRKGDLDLMPMLKNIRKAIDVEEASDIVPEFVLTCRPDNNVLYLRKNGYALRFIEGFRAYNSADTPDVNLRALKNEFATDAGGGRIAYPFNLIYGKGVQAAQVASRDSAFGEWFWIKNLQLKAAHIRIGE